MIMTSLSSSNLGLEMTGNCIKIEPIRTPLPDPLLTFGEATAASIPCAAFWPWADGRSERIPEYCWNILLSSQNLKVNQDQSRSINGQSMVNFNEFHPNVAKIKTVVQPSLPQNWVAGWHGIHHRGAGSTAWTWRCITFLDSLDSQLHLKRDNIHIYII